MLQIDAGVKSVAQTLEAVVTGALEHKDAETQNVQALMQLHTAARDAEVGGYLAAKKSDLTKPLAQIARLQKQNNRLTQLLLAERDASAKTRDNMVQQIANLLAGFTQAQDQRLSAAIGGLQEDNTSDLVEVDRHMALFDDQIKTGSRLANEFAGDMEAVRAAGEQATEQLIEVGVSLAPMDTDS